MTELVVKSFMFGKSSQNLPILAYKFGNSGPQILILGGVHGDETEGVVGAHALISEFDKSFSLKLQITVVPMFNVDGVIAQDRQNANHVDLNRNLPTNDWTNDVAEPRYYPGDSAGSETENQALVNWLNEYKPRLVISLHSFKNPMLNTNGACHPEAEVIAGRTGYEIHESIGYPTPGCLGTYCGLERDMPTLTYEFLRGMDKKEILDRHIPAILEALKVTEQRH